MNKILILAIILLSGCSTMKDKFCDYKMIPPEKPIEIDKRLLEPCKDWIPPKLPISPEEILENTKANKLISLECSNKQDASIVVIKKLSNNK